MLQRGFTLVELLVVISIVSLLSSMSLAAMSEARYKANNSAINSQMLQYRNAVELYASDHNGYYPVPDSSSVSIVASCLGTYNSPAPYAGGKCGKSSLTVNPSTSLTNSLITPGYLRTFPPIGKGPVTFSDSTQWLGAIYECDPSLAGNSLALGCRSSYALWYIFKPSQNCAPGKAILAGVDPVTQLPISDDPLLTLCQLNFGA
jgi:prepilin-type N-terminal cleavage/methylation domain-containing protein